jgi:Zn-dependent peptidase ImmA (M78 family)
MGARRVARPQRRTLVNASRPLPQRKAEQVAREVLERFKVTEPPVVVEELAAFLGAEIRRRPNSPDIAGLLYREGSAVIIGVNADDAEVRQRFTIAHEIGHLQLHKRETFFVDRTYRAASKDSTVFGDAAQEREANWFAAELLMPEDMIHRVANDLLKARWMTDDALVEALSQRFRVSRQAMAFRLLNLGVVNGL